MRDHIAPAAIFFLVRLGFEYIEDWALGSLVALASLHALGDFVADRGQFGDLAGHFRILSKREALHVAAHLSSVEVKREKRANIVDRKA